MKILGSNPSRFRANKTLLALAVTTALGQSSAWAQVDPARPFELGTVTVSATRPQIGAIGEDQVGSLVTRKEMQQFNRNDVADALDLLPGVTASNNSRNEKTVYVRGFDMRQVPLFIDGIPVYIPYDGYVDFGRFATADLSAIQVAKGFSSVSYGPNVLGGAINLISRKPVSVFEGDVKVGFASGREKQTAVNVGTNQGMWYLQAGASYIDSDYFPLSSDFKATTIENGGHRENSYRKDSKLSLKIGLTPNTSDEYALSYYQQNGEKGQPPSTDPAVARYWKWPYWDKESLYFISKTAFSDFETLKLRLFNDKFDNEVNSYTNASYTTLKKTGAGSVSTGRSIYNDETSGGSIEIETLRIRGNALKFVTHYKEDQHRETDANNQENAKYKDTLRSYAVEDNIDLAPRWMLSLGYAYNELSPNSVFTRGSTYALPKKQSAEDKQGGLFFDYADNVRFYTTIAEKTRLPTLKDRYSARLGDYIANPALRPEEATNYEIGYQGQPWFGAKAAAAIFYSDINDKIQSVFVGIPASKCTGPANRCQMQNVGKVRMKGTELSLSSPITSWLEAGATFTLLDMENISDPQMHVLDIPSRKLTANLLIRPAARVDVIAFIETDNGRWASNTIRLSGFTTANLKAVYRPAKNISTEIGVSNLTDQNYQLADGFPNPGRMYFANASYQF